MIFVLVCGLSNSLSSPPSHIRLLGEIKVQSSNGLDFEDSPRLRLVVKAETLTSTTFMAVNLILQDVNDNLPRFQLQNYVAYMREAQGYDTAIIQVMQKKLQCTGTLVVRQCAPLFSCLFFLPVHFLLLRWWLRMWIRAKMVR